MALKGKFNLARFARDFERKDKEGESIGIFYDLGSGETVDGVFDEVLSHSPSLKNNQAVRRAYKSMSPSDKTVCFRIDWLRDSRALPREVSKAIEDARHAIRDARMGGMRSYKSEKRQPDKTEEEPELGFGGVPIAKEVGKFDLEGYKKKAEALLDDNKGLEELKKKRRDQISVLEKKVLQEEDIDAAKVLKELKMNEKVFSERDVWWLANCVNEIDYIAGDGETLENIFQRLLAFNHFDNHFFAYNKFFECNKDLKGLKNLKGKRVTVPLFIVRNSIYARPIEDVIEGIMMKARVKIAKKTKSLKELDAVINKKAKDSKERKEAEEAAEDAKVAAAQCCLFSVFKKLVDWL